MALDASANAATFTVDLEAGSDRLYTWFRGNGQAICGAYYVYVERL